jgi:hypothetical protein
MLDYLSPDPSSARRSTTSDSRPAPPAAQPDRSSASNFFHAAVGLCRNISEFVTRRRPEHPVECLAAFVPFGTTFSCLFHAIADIPGLDVPPPAYPLCWEGWLESWYQMFDDRIWSQLSKDDTQDRRNLNEHLARLAMLQSDTDDALLSKEVKAVKEDIRNLQGVLMVRMESCFGSSFVSSPSRFAQLIADGSPLSVSPPLRPHPLPRRTPLALQSQRCRIPRVASSR